MIRIWLAFVFVLIVVLSVWMGIVSLDSGLARKCLDHGGIPYTVGSLPFCYVPAKGSK